ncbi:MAG: DctP family TRAP transporter solute-binding subunit [Desulfovibrio sp.]|nr:DctP family TRAP transporter solute-binding subunit [Desulfovibrio sp.]
MRFLIIILALVFSHCNASAAELTLRLGHIAEEDNPYAMGAEYFANLVQKKTNGQISIKIYPSGALGNQGDLIQGISNGTIDLALTSCAVLANYIPELSVFELPFIFRDRSHAHKALDSIGMRFSRKGESKGIITLAFWENGIRQMTNNIRPIIKPSDMEGLKMRVMEQQICIAMMRLLGAKPIPMPITELYTALKNGIVDGQENPLAHIATKHYYEVQKYVSLTSHTYTAEPLLISKHIWDKLTQEQQLILINAANETRDWQRNLCLAKEQEYLKIIRDSKQCNIIENVDIDAFRKVTQKTWEIYSIVFGDKTLQEVHELR